MDPFKGHLDCILHQYTLSDQMCEVNEAFYRLPLLTLFLPHYKMFSYKKNWDALFRITILSTTSAVAAGRVITRARSARRTVHAIHNAPDRVWVVISPMIGQRCQ